MIDLPSDSSGVHFALLRIFDGHIARIRLSSAVCASGPTRRESGSRRHQALWGECIIRPSHLQLDPASVYAFVIAMFAHEGDMEQLQTRRLLLKHLLCGNILEYLCELKIIMRAHPSVVLHTVDRFLQGRKGRLDELKLDLTSGQEVRTGDMDFTPECRLHTCRAFRNSEGDFSAIRRKAGEVVYDRIVKWTHASGRFDPVQLEQLIWPDILCYGCSRRLAKTFCEIGQLAVLPNSLNNII